MDQDSLRFSVDNMWVSIGDDHHATVGLTEEAFQNHDEINKLKLPGEGEEVVKEEAFGRLTTNRPGVIRLYAPISGEVVEVNEDVLDSPELVLEDPYEDGWLIRLDMSNPSEFDDLMTRDEYDDFLGEEDDVDIDDDELDDEDDEDEEDEDDDDY